MPDLALISAVSILINKAEGYALLRLLGAWPGLGEQAPLLPRIHGNMP